jgi:two-component system, cell cycle response regulator DivK
VILIADDTTDSRDLYAEYFETRGFSVVTARDGTSAVQAALEHLPDVIVMDLAMPQIDGITAIQRIKADARLQQTRVILLTGYHLALEKSALEAGADLFLRKPCLPERLESHVNGLRQGRAPDTDPPAT